MPGPGYSYLGDEEHKNIDDVLRTWELTRYAYDKPDAVSFVRRFEESVCARFEVPYCIAVNSGTSALLAALAALDIGPGDEVIVPGYTFIASIGSIVYAGATPVLAEIDESLTLDMADVESRITDRTKAIMAVHMLGAPCDMRALQQVAARHGLLLIEDVAQACGGLYRGRRLGTLGDAGAFSLNPFKMITTGEGGLFVTREWAAYQRGYSFHDQGWFPLRDVRTADAGDGDLLFGINLRMTDLVGAVGLAQLEKLDDILKATRRGKQELTSMIEPRPGMRPRTVHDTGECATLAVYVFDDVAMARQVATDLGTKTLHDSGRHYYANMPQLLALGRGDGKVSPFRSIDVSGSHSYEPGSLPQTDDVLRRAVAISVGVSDSYLGAGFGATVRSKDEELQAVAERFNTAVGKALS